MRHEPAGATVCAGGGQDGETAAERTHDLGRPHRSPSGRYWPIFQTLLEPDAVITDWRRQGCKDIVARKLR